MANRFVHRIKSGEIESIEDLKSEFKELAKRTHPDLRGQDPVAGAEFVAVRAEYESALRGFERHRFGAARGRRATSDAEPGAAPGSDAAWACLGLLLKRGFPKTPRHEKERLRYEYARWRYENALGPEGRELFEAFEAELLDQKAMGIGALATEMALLRDLLDYREWGLAAMRTHIVLSLGALRADPRIGAAYLSFARALALGLGVGGEIGD